MPSFSGQAEAGSGFPEQDFEFRAFRRTGAIDAETPQLPGRNLDIAAFIDQRGGDRRRALFQERFKRNPCIFRHRQIDAPTDN